MRDHAHLAISVLVIIVFLLSVGQSSAADIRLWGLGGLTSGPSDEVGDFLDGGITLAGEGYVSLTPNIYAGGGIHLEILGGHTDDEFDIELTDGGVVFGMQAGGIAVLPLEEQPITPFVGLSLGRAGMAWGYTEDVQSFLGEDGDGIGFWYAAFQGGAIFSVSEMLGFVGGARFVLGSYGDETVEGHRWDRDGGSFVQAFVGLELRP